MKKEDLWRLLEVLQDHSLWEVVSVGASWSKFYKLKDSDLYVVPFDIVRCHVGILAKDPLGDFVIDKCEVINKWLLFDWWSLNSKIIGAVSDLQNYFIDLEQEEKSNSITGALREYKVNKEHQ